MLKTIQEYEGLRLRAYEDTVGILTIGYGCNLEAVTSGQLASVGIKLVEVVRGKAITKEQAEKLFDIQLAAIVEEIENSAIPYYDQPEIIKEIIRNLCFNMGVAGVLKFKRTLVAIKNGDYALAADHLEDSKWYGQVGRRSKDIVDTLRDI